MQIDGKPVIDAKRAITLIVTEEDTKNADRKDPDSCAFARTCLRELHAKEVRVHLGRVYVRTNSANWQRYITPRPLKQEIIAFDRGGAFAPGAYTITAPTPSKTTGKMQGTSTGQGSIPWTKGGRKGKGKTKRRSPHIVTDVRATITRHYTDGK